MNIRQSFNRALLGAVCGALLLVSPASAAEKKIVMRYSHSSSAMDSPCSATRTNPGLAGLVPDKAYNR